jgi:HK97 family phage portal protein
MSMLSLATRGRKGIDQEALAQPYGGSYSIDSWRSWQGYGISPETAYNIITVYQCVRVLAETFASLPLIVYRRLPGGGKERAEEHDLYDVLHRRPNADMTSFIWRELMMGHLGTWGNSYHEKTRDATGRLNLWPIRPDRVEPFYYSDEQASVSPWPVRAGMKGYWYLGSTGNRKELDPTTIFHVQGLSSNGLVGLSPISVMRSTIRLYSTAERFGTAFFDNDARPGTILSHPMQAMKGPDNAGKTIVLEEGLTVSEIGIHPEDAQFMETRLFQKREIGAAFRIPPHKIGDLERATFSNIEQQSIEFIQDTMLPWFVRTEQQVNTQLIEPRDQDEYYAEFLVDGYLRGDAQARAAALATRWQHGTISADEWRERENENPLPDGLGKQYYVPVNYTPVGQPEPEAVAVPAPGPNGNGFATLATRSLARFDCPTCGKLIARLAAPGTVGYCKDCRIERTMVESASKALPEPPPPPEVHVTLPEINIHPPSVHVTLPEMRMAPSRPPDVNVTLPEINVRPPSRTPDIRVTLEQDRKPVTKRIERDKAGQITAIVEE